MTDRGQTTAVQRICFPLPGDEETLGLYVRGENDLSWTRRSLTVPSGSSASLGTYFGAFPAGYWRTYAHTSRVTLEARVAGAARLLLCAADADNARIVVAVEDVVDADVRIGVATSQWMWLWIEIEAADFDATIADAAWMLEDTASGDVAICITTHDRPADCVRVLERLADETAASLVPQIIVVDQGSRAVSRSPEWEAVARRLGDRLQYVVQPNLGGSGGYSRGLIEALRGNARYMLLLDDDIQLEPESLVRMIAFADRTGVPTIVGAQMLSATDRTLLHTFGEQVRRRGFRWAAVAPELAPIDVADHTPPETGAMRRVYDVDFNGWWMCLLPRETVERIGLALPYFIKWDDAEFGMRAHAAGTPTVTLPGAAVWHMPWTGKDDGLDWQAYYQLRNRLVTAILRAEARRGGGVLRASMLQDVNHVICMQYGSAASRVVAMRDVLSGPAHLYPTLLTKLAEMRELMRRTGQVVVPDADLPEVEGDHPAPSAPRGVMASAARLLRVAAHQLRPVPVAAQGQMRVALERSEGRWWALGILDGALVRSATGTGAFVMRRRPRVALSLIVEATLLRTRLWVRWPALQRSYRRASSDLVSHASWEAVFAEAAAPNQTVNSRKTE